MSVILALPAPNYVNPEEHSPATSIVNLVMCPLVIFVTLLRVWTRLRVSRTFGIDDLLILIALVSGHPALLKKKEKKKKKKKKKREGMREEQKRKKRKKGEKKIC